MLFHSSDNSSLSPTTSPAFLLFALPSDPDAMFYAFEFLFMLSPSRLGVYASKSRAEAREEGERAFGSGGVEFNRGFYLASCFESINSETTLLIDIIDSNYAPLYVVWLYRHRPRQVNSSPIRPPRKTDASVAQRLMKKFLIN